jgi:hypothetical protein
MKAKLLILVLLLSVSQAYAWGDRERSALLGFIGGVVVSNIIQNNTERNNHSTLNSVIYYKEVPKRVARDNHYKQHRKVAKKVRYYSYSDRHNAHKHRGYYRNNHRNNHRKRYEGYYLNFRTYKS